MVIEAPQVWTIEDEFLCTRFGSDALLRAAMRCDMLGLPQRDASRAQADPGALDAALRILLASGFHSLGSFTRAEPYTQLTYVVPFVCSLFGQASSLQGTGTVEDCFALAHAEFGNFELVRTDSGGDTARACAFLLKLHDAGRLYQRPSLGRYLLAQQARA